MSKYAVLTLLTVLPSVALAQGDMAIEFDLADTAGDEATYDALRVTADPPRLLLGVQESATIQVDLSGLTGVPTDVRVYSNAGFVGVTERSGDKIFTAPYSAPGEMYPHLAIIAAVALVDGKPYTGWTVLPLAGQGELEVEGKASQLMSVKIGEREFGPVPADSSGLAKVKVEVDPGYGYGYSGKTKIPLGVAPFSQILAVPVHDRIEVGVDTEVRVFVVTKTGEPYSDAKLRLKAKRGSVDAPRETAPGVYSATYSPPGRVGRKPPLIEARLARSKASRSSFEYELVAALPPSLRLSLSQEKYVPGAPPPVLQIRVFGGNGNPRAAALAVEAGVGSFGQVEEIETGYYEAGLVLPDPLPSIETVNISVRVEDESDPPVIETIVLPVDRTGTSTSADGKAAPWVSDAAGGVERDEGVAGELKKQAVVETRPEVAQPLQLALGGHVGFQSNLVALYAPTAAVDVTFAPGGSGILGDLLGQLELGFLYQYGETELADGPLKGRNYERHLLALPVTLTGDYRVRFFQDFSVFLGAGGSMTYVLSSVGDRQQHSLSWGAVAQGGLTWALGPGELVAKLRYTYGGLQQPFGGVLFLVGYSYGLL